MAIEHEKSAQTVPEFCSDHSISTGFFYKLLKQGKAPKTIKVAGRRLISREAAEEWRRRFEQDQAAA